MRIVSFFAYLDPNMGSVVFQSIIGVVAGIGVFGRKLFSGVGHKVKGIFSSRSESAKSPEK